MKLPKGAVSWKQGEPEVIDLIEPFDDEVECYDTLDTKSSQKAIENEYYEDS